jgi:glycosyltransferase involved in cell wall biosynthesis
MRIAIVSSGHIPSQWAHSINTVKHANAFREIGHEVELLTVMRLKERQTVRLEYFDINHWYGVTDIKVKYFIDYSFYYFSDVKSIVTIIYKIEKIIPWIRFLKIRVEKNISKYIKANNFDFVYCRTYGTALFNLKYGIPTSIETHNPHPENDIIGKRLFRKMDSKYFVNLITIHEKLKQHYISLSSISANSIVKGDAVDLKQFESMSCNLDVRNQLGIMQNVNIVMYCGSLKRGKGIQHILSTAEQLLENKNIVFIIVGGTKSEVQKWKNISPGNIHYCGFLPHSLIPSYLDAADILFMPYNVKEEGAVMDIHTSSPIKLFEYLAAGKVILSTNIPIISSIIKDGIHGYLSDINNYSVTIEHIINMSKKEKKSIGASAKILASTYTYTGRARAIINGYELYIEKRMEANAKEIISPEGSRI